MFRNTQKVSGDTMMEKRDKKQHSPGGFCEKQSRFTTSYFFSNFQEEISVAFITTLISVTYIG